MGENSVVMLKIPSNLRSGKGAATEQEMRVATLQSRSVSGLGIVVVDQDIHVPRLAQLDLSLSILVAKLEIDGPVFVLTSSICAYTLL